MKNAFHVHTLYCDGKNTCEEIVLQAIKYGFDAIGFSGHSYTSFDESYCMSKQNTRKYVNDVEYVKNKYRNDIRVYCGIEQEYYAEKPDFTPDYIIGSVHYIIKGGEYIPIDDSRGELSEAVNKYYGGDFYSLAEDYFRTVSDVVQKTDCDIIGHFDLVSKFNEDKTLFDESNPRYIAAWKNALDILLPEDRIFEVNTGAMSRGYRTLPYPSRDMLSYIAKNGGRVTVTTDCHDMTALDYGTETAFALIKETGAEYVDFETVLLTEKLKV